MVQGTDNILLNCAFKEMQAENHSWLRNIQYFLYKYGLGDVWSNPHVWEKNSLKSILSQRLKDIHIQKYNEYLGNGANKEKCYIINNCVKNQSYMLRKYLHRVLSPDIRSTFTKLRVDMNNTLDCKNRSFRYRNVTENNCSKCGVIQNVEHVLLHCKSTEMIKNRSIFESKYSKIADKYIEASPREKIKEILSCNPKCSENKKEEAVKLICNYVKFVYSITSNMQELEADNE